MKKGDCYYSKDSRHAKIRNCLFFTIMNLLLPKLQKVLLEKKHEKLCNYNYVALAARMSHVGI